MAPPRVSDAPPLAELCEAVVHYPSPSKATLKSTVSAVDGASLRIRAGEAVGLIGESGSGKTTLARCLLGLVRPHSGQALLAGEDLWMLSAQRRRSLRRRVQVVFQDPTASLNPRLTVNQALAEPLSVHRMRPQSEVADRVHELLECVGLSGALLARYPHELSGGQCQRLAIARALTVEPELLIADEPVSALDVSVQAMVLNLLQELREQLRLAYLLITHDLRLVEHMCDRVAVMHCGRIIESGPSAAIYDDPRHPYTQELLSAAPAPGRVLPALRAAVPLSAGSALGCAYAVRCARVESACERTVPGLKGVTGVDVESDASHRVACFVD